MDVSVCAQRLDWKTSPEVICKSKDSKSCWEWLFDSSFDSVAQSYKRIYKQLASAGLKVILESSSQFPFPCWVAELGALEKEDTLSPGIERAPAAPLSFSRALPVLQGPISMGVLFSSLCFVEK